MDDRKLVARKSNFSNNSWDVFEHENKNLFKINNTAMATDEDEFLEKQNTIFRNQSSSIMRESSVVTRTVVRKKTMMINGEIVEQEEEESEEIQPNSREFASQSDSLYVNGDLFQGSSFGNNRSLPSTNPGTLNTINTNWKQSGNDIFSETSSKFPFRSSNIKSSQFGDTFFENSSRNLGTTSVNFQSANIKSTERMMAFQTSINGKVNPPVIKMEKNSMFYNNSDIPDQKNKKLALLDREEKNGEEKPIKDSSKKKSLLNKLGIGGKKEDDMKENVRVNKIIEEILSTEIKYISDLSKVVDDYMVELNRPDAPKELVKDKYGMFGNIEHIYMFHDVQFQTDLKECEKTPTGIANCFLKHAKEFALYRHYNRNKPFTEAKLSKYEHFFTEKLNQINDIHSLSSYLITPTQRIGRYILLLREMAKECKKNKVSVPELNEAIQMLETEVKFGNDLMALDALQGLPEHLDIKGQGDLIYRDKFTVSPPDKGRKYEAMIFLFKEMIIISDVQLENNIDKHCYKDNIRLSEVGLTECHNEPKIFKIWYLKHNKKNYTLQTKPEIKKLWVAEIRKQLENELQKKKAESSRNSTIDESKFIDLNQRKYIDIDVKKK